MAYLYQNIGQIILIIPLLVGSAFFSGCETAFFNLSPRQKRDLALSKHKIPHLITSMLKKPSGLLSCFLLGNMLVNVLFFAVASVLIIHARQQVGVPFAAVVAFSSFAILVLLGEVFPKTLAYANPRYFTLFAALPAFVCLKVFTPLLFTFRLLVIEPAVRLLLGSKRHPKPVTADEFKALIERVRKKGLITSEENKLLTGIVELGSLKVRDCLRPRVDMHAVVITEKNKNVRSLLRNKHLKEVTVYKDITDNIIGKISFRQLLLHPEKPIKELLEPVHFVPEQKTVDSLLEHFKKSGTDSAIVVDEYGALAGSVHLEDVADKLLRPVDLPSAVKPVQRIGPFKYRLAGSLAIHDWAQAFGIQPEELRISTVAGLVTALLGKVPRPGDVANLQNLRFTVETMKNHRIETVLLTLEPLSKYEK